MNRFWDSDGEESDREVLQVNVTSDEMEMEAGKKSTGGKDELSLAERLLRREKKKADKKRRAQKRLEVKEDLVQEDDSTSTNTVEEVIVSKKRRVKRKKLSFDLPELKLMRVDEVEEDPEEVTDEVESKMEVEETVEKVEDKEFAGKEEDKEEGEKVEKREVEQPEAGKSWVEEECDKEKKMEEEEVDLVELGTKKEARKEANRWRKVLDGVRDMLDEFEDSGMARSSVRKYRRDLEGVKGGLARLAGSGVWPESREEKDPAKKEMKEEKLIKIKAEKEDEKEVGSSTKIKRELMPIIVDQWVTRWSELGKEDIKIQVFDCEEGWMERDVRGGLWE